MLIRKVDSIEDIKIEGIDALILPATNISFCLQPVPLIDMVNYTKLVGFKTIQGLADDNEIDTVYV